MSIQVSVENLGPCRKLLRIEVPGEQVNAAFDEVTGRFQREAALPGFRQGRAPRHLVARNFGPRISEEVKRQLLDSSFKEAVEKEKLRVIVTLNTEELGFGRGMPLQYAVTLEHAPDFVTPTYRNLPARREIASPTDADVERAIGILQEQKVEYRDVARPAQLGDVAVVDYKGAAEGRPITDFNATALGLTSKSGFWVTIDEKAFIPGFGSGLVGASAGETRTVQLQFPEDFVIKEVANKPGSFEVTVTAVKERLLPPADDAFAQGLGAENLEALREGVRRDLQTELDFRAKRGLRDQLLHRLLEQVEFELPESVVTSETRGLVYNIVNENQRRGVAPEVLEARKDEIFGNASASARDRVKAAFILNRIAEAEKISVSQKELLARVQAMAEQSRTPVERVIKSLEERNGVRELQQDILTGKVLDWIEINAMIEDVHVAAPTPGVG